MTVADHRQRLIFTLGLALDALKAREVRDPGSQVKNNFEKRIEKIIYRAFLKQKKRVRDYLLTVERQPVEGPGNEDPDLAVIAKFLEIKDDEFYRQLTFFDDDDLLDLIKALWAAFKAGVDLFSENMPFELDLSVINQRAADWARQNAGTLLTGIARRSIFDVRYAVSAYIADPGMTLAQVMNYLPFERWRAQRIAITEITRAFAEGNQEAANELQLRYPDVPVIKIWFTNYDDKVCPDCRDLDGKKVPKDDFFNAELEIENPPAHVNCRCWTDFSTQIPPAAGPGTQPPEASTGVPGLQPGAPIMGSRNITMEERENDPSYYEEDREHAYFYDAATGELIFAQSGGRDQVAFDDDQINALRAHGHAILLHNHPNSSPLSPQDVGFTQTANLYQVRAVGRRGIYVLTRPPSGWNHSDELWQKACAAGMAFARKYVLEHGVKPDFRVVNHYICEVWAKEQGYGYEFIQR